MNEISPETFVKTVIGTVHKNYPAYRKQVYRWHAMKLVLDIAHVMAYDGLPNGLYLFGRYSFVAGSVFNDLRYEKSLQSVKISKSEINAPLALALGPVIARFKDYFTADARNRIPYPYTDTIPKKYQNFYAAHNELLGALKLLYEVKGKKELMMCSDSITAIITRFEFYLLHVDEERLQTYYDFTALVENILAAAKNGDASLVALKPLFEVLYVTYKDSVAAFLMPFPDTLEGKNKERELFLYHQNLASLTVTIHHTIHTIESKAKLLGLVLVPEIPDLFES